MTEKLSAFVLGATGQVGRALAKELTRTDAIGRVTLFSRREIDVSQGDKDNNDYSKFDVKVVDFDKLETDHIQDFQGYDIGFCAMGVIGGASNETKKKVDHDYLIAAAKLAKDGGTNSLNVVTGAGANKDSSLFMFSNKGLIEHDLQALGFERLAFYRTGALVKGEAENLPLSYRIGNPLFQTLDCSRVMSCEVPVLAKVMVYNSLQPAKSPVDVYENREIHKLGKELSKPKTSSV